VSHLSLAQRGRANPLPIQGGTYYNLLAWLSCWQHGYASKIDVLSFDFKPSQRAPLVPPVEKNGFVDKQAHWSLNFA